jgi:hypothetical protein
MSGTRIPPLLVCGAAGSGKSYQIEQYAKERGLEVLICPCRIDRTLREQRTKLHEWAHRLQPSILWLEGADDLTPEAQSFLRRILETNSPNVHFILECRTIESIQEPIRSRCMINLVSMPTKDQLITYGESLGLDTDTVTEAIEYWPPSKRTWRQIEMLKFAETHGFDGNYINIWNNAENEFIGLTPELQHQYLKCRHSGGNPLAYAALREEMKKAALKKDGE